MSPGGRFLNGAAHPALFQQEPPMGGYTAWWDEFYKRRADAEAQAVAKANPPPVPPEPLHASATVAPVPVEASEPTPAPLEPPRRRGGFRRGA